MSILIVTNSHPSYEFLIFGFILMLCVFLGLEICPDDSTKGPITLDSVTSPTSPDGAEDALKPTGWTPSPGDDNPVLELKPTDSSPIMNIAVETEFVDSVVFKLYKDGVLVAEKTVKV
jgi:hypothetical protein